MKGLRTLAAAALVSALWSCSSAADSVDPVCREATAYLDRLQTALDQARVDLLNVEQWELDAERAFASGDGSPDDDTYEANRAARAEVEPRKDSLDRQLFAAQTSVRARCP